MTDPETTYEWFGCKECGHVWKRRTDAAPTKNRQYYRDFCPKCKGGRQFCEGFLSKVEAQNFTGGGRVKPKTDEPSLFG